MRLTLLGLWGISSAATLFGQTDSTLPQEKPFPWKLVAMGVIVVLITGYTAYKALKNNRK